MKNTNKLLKRSVSSGGGETYSTEYINRIITQTHRQTEQLVYCLYYIQNCIELPIGLLEAITHLRIFNV